MLRSRLSVLLLAVLVGCTDARAPLAPSAPADDSGGPNRAPTPWTLRTMEFPRGCANLQGAGNDINSAGAIVGWTTCGPPGTIYSPTLWRPGGLGPRVLPIPPGITRAWATAINNRGEMVGWGDDWPNVGGQVALYWPSVGSMVVITGPPGYYLRAHGIDDKGNASGASFIGGMIAAYSWFGGTFNHLPAYGGESIAIRASGNGTVVGYAKDSLNLYHAVTWNGGVLTDLGVNGGAATAASDNGIIVGQHYSYLSTGWFLKPGGHVSALPVVPGSLWGVVDRVKDVNNSLVVVGSAWDSVMLREFAFAWDPALRDPVWLPKISSTHMSRANGVNNCGEIVGEAWVPSGHNVPLLWTRTC